MTRTIATYLIVAGALVASGACRGKRSGTDHDKPAGPTHPAMTAEPGAKASAMRMDLDVPDPARRAAGAANARLQLPEEAPPPGEAGKPASAMRMDLEVPDEARRAASAASAASAAAGADAKPVPFPDEPKPR